MAKLEVCVVWDAAVQAYMRPIFVPHTGAAVRGFRDEVNRGGDAQGPLAAHPEDYELHYLGKWDEETGEFEPVGAEADVVLLRGKDAVSLK